MKLCASPEYLERCGTPRRASDLSAHNCLSYSLSPFQNGRDWSFGLEGEIKVPVRGNLKADNGHALLAAAVGGQGIIYQPNFIVGDALVSGELVAIELDQPLLELGGIHLLFAPDRRQPVKIRAMIDFLVEAFAQSPCARVHPPR